MTKTYRIEVFARPSTLKPDLQSLPSRKFIKGAVFSAADYDLAKKNGRIIDQKTGFDGITIVGLSDCWVTKAATESTSADNFDSTVAVPDYLE